MTYVNKDALSDPGAYAGVSARPRPVSVKPAETVATPQEKAAQEAYAVQIEAQADAIPDQELSRAHRAKARRVRDSLPIMEYFERLKTLREAANDVGPGFDMIENKAGYADAMDQLRDANAYNPLLLSILEASQSRSVRPVEFLGPQPTEADTAAVDAANVILGVEKARTVRQLGQRELVDRAVAKAMAPTATRINRLRKELDEFQESWGVR